jgi:hypothetical protein
MNTQRRWNPIKKHFRGAGLSLGALFLTVMVATPAYSFQFGQGDLTGNLDTTLSYGLM